MAMRKILEDQSFKNAATNFQKEIHAKRQSGFLQEIEKLIVPIEDANRVLTELRN
jgi:hypothetical protein